MGTRHLESPTTRPKVAKSWLQGMHECTQLGSVGKSGLVHKWLLCWGTRAVSSAAKMKFLSLYRLKPPLLWPPRNPPLRVPAQLGLTHSLLASLYSRRVLSRELLAGQARRASRGGEQLKPLCSSCRSDPWSPEQADPPGPWGRSCCSKGAPGRGPEEVGAHLHSPPPGWSLSCPRNTLALPLRQI